MNQAQRDALGQIELGIRMLNEAESVEYRFWDSDRQWVIKEYCDIGGEVGRYMRSRHAYDCFCEDREKAGHYPMTNSYSEVVLDFVRTAVREKMGRDGPYQEDDND